MALVLTNGILGADDTDSSWVECTVLNTSCDTVYEVKVVEGILEIVETEDPEDNTGIVDSTDEDKVYYLAMEDDGTLWVEGIVEEYEPEVTGEKVDEIDRKIKELNGVLAQILAAIEMIQVSEDEQGEAIDSIPLVNGWIAVP